MSRTTQSAKRRVMVREAGILCPVGRIVIFSSNSRTVSEPSQSPIQQVHKALSQKLDPLFMSGSKKCKAPVHLCGAVLVTGPISLHVHWSPRVPTSPSGCWRKAVKPQGCCSRPGSLRRRTWPSVSADTSHKIHCWSDGYRSNYSNGLLIWFR